jgi:hypothetical protein
MALTSDLLAGYATAILAIDACPLHATNDVKG